MFHEILHFSVNKLDANVYLPYIKIARYMHSVCYAVMNTKHWIVNGYHDW
jgi:hypothetical protein